MNPLWNAVLVGGWNRAKNERCVALLIASEHESRADVLASLVSSICSVRPIPLQLSLLATVPTSLNLYCEKHSKRRREQMERDHF